MTLDFRAASLACKVLNYYYTEGGCDGLETWAKATLTFTIFHQRCVVKLAFLMEVRLPVRVWLRVRVSVRFRVSVSVRVRVRARVRIRVSVSVSFSVRVRVRVRVSEARP